MPRLILEAGGRAREYEIKGTVIIGRQKTCTIPIDDRLLSREHIRINVEPLPDGSSRCQLQDLGSKNGTFVNGQLLKHPHVLQEGDKIKIGTHVFRFHAVAGAAAPPPAAPPPPRPAVKGPAVPAPPPMPPPPPPAPAAPAHPAAAKPASAPPKAPPAKPAPVAPPSAVAPPPPPPPRRQPGRRSILQAMQPSAAASFVFNIVLLVVLVVGTFVSRTIFVSLFSKLGSE